MTSVKSTDLTTTTVEPTESMGTSTATSPPALNTSTVTEATTEPVFPAQPPVTPFPVVRVFGTATNESQPLPADGVCDYTFYDGLYDTGPFDTLYSPHFSAPVEHVLSHASLHSFTEYGLSFAYRNASQVARDLEISEKAIHHDDMAEAAAKFCTRVIRAEVDGGFVDRLLWTCRNWFRQLDIPLPRSTYWAPVEPKTQKNTGQKLIAIVKFIAALLSDVPENQGAASMGSLHCGHIFSMAVLLCDSCRLVMISPQLDYEAKVECLRTALTTAGEAAERGAPARMAALVACLRDAFLSSDVPEKARLTLLELLELRASGWKLSL
ncbi:hypothetical protein MRX96_057260 [Rhipicephalus microplus]